MTANWKLQHQGRGTFVVMVVVVVVGLPNANEAQQRSQLRLVLKMLLRCLVRNAKNAQS